MPYCVLLKNGLYVDAQGKTRPCCSFMFNEEIDNFELTPSKRESLYNKMLKGWVPECHHCKKDEEFQEQQGSLRTISNKHEEEHPGYNFVHLDVSNQCNLACRMCGVSQSTGWNPVRLYYNEGEEIYN